MERIVKNVFHGTEIKYRSHVFESEGESDPLYDLYGFITIKDIDTSKGVHICDICDPGLGENYHAEARPSIWSDQEGREKEMQGEIDLEIWILGDPDLKEKTLKENIDELEKKVSKLEREALIKNQAELDFLSLNNP